MQYGDESKTKCPTITEPVMLEAECDTKNFSSYNSFYEFYVESPPVEWYGSCHWGSCQVCDEGDTSCDGRRSCVNGEWRMTGHSVLHFSEQKMDAFLFTACTLLGCCFLALLGIIAAVVMLK
jgi:hypothetical protein